MGTAYVVTNPATGECHTLTCAAAVMAIIDNAGHAGVWRVACVPTLSRPASTAAAEPGDRCEAAPDGPPSPPSGRPAAT